MITAMIITFTGDDGVKQKWDFDPAKVLVDDAEEIEYQFKGSFDEFRAGVLRGVTRARRVLLWHLQRRTHPSLAFGDMPPFATGQVEVDFGRDELLEMRKRTEVSALSPADKDNALAWIDGELAKHVTPEDVTGDKGKATRRGGTTTPSKSPATSASPPPSSGN